MTKDIIDMDFGNRFAAVMHTDLKEYHEGRITPMADRITALEAVQGMDGREVEFMDNYYPKLEEGAVPEEGQLPAIIWRLKPRDADDMQIWRLLVYLSEITGADGAEGLKGDKGDKGDAGRGLDISGVVSTSSELVHVLGAIIGSLYVATDTKELWLCKSLPSNVMSAWEHLGASVGIKGDKGDTGATGARGAKGDKGDNGGISSFLLNWIVGTATNQAISTVTMQLNTSINDAINDMAMQLGNLAEDAAESAVSKTIEDMYDELKGEKGEKGADGKDGAACTIVGHVLTINDLPVIGNAGDGYLVGVENSLYIWIAPSWVFVGEIKGDKGDKGDTGDAGKDAEFPPLIADKFLSNNGLEVEWVDIGLPNSANKDEANDFTNLDQTIGGYSIVNAVYSPRIPSVAATRAGMMHVKIPASDTDTTVKVWVSVATTGGAYEWVALETGTGGSDIPEDVVRKNSPNDFNDIHQTIGTNQIVTVIDGGANSVPAATNPDFDGQLFLSYRNVGSDEAQAAMWVAKGNQWLPIASGSGGVVDDSNLAKLDVQNIFAMPQLIGEGGQRAKFVSGRRTSYDPTSSSSPDFLPYAEGDLLFRHYLDGGVSKEQIYMAGIAGDANSWTLIYDSEESVTAVAGELALLDSRVDALSDKLDLEIADLDNLSTTVGDIDSSITGIEGDISLVGTKVDLLEPRIIANEEKIAALETHHTNNQTTFASHDTRITTLEEGGDSGSVDLTPVTDRLDVVERDVSTLEATTATHTADITNLEDECSNLQIGINGNSSEIVLAKGRLDAVEAKVPDTLEAGKLLVVNSAGDGVEMSTLSSAEALALKSFAEGSATGDTLLSTKCLGGDTLIYSGNCTAAQTSGSNFVFGVPASGTTKTCELGDIVSYDSTDVGSGKVREGCLLTIVNAGAGTFQITTAGSTKIQGRSGSWDSYNLATNKTLLLIPQIWTDGTKCFNIVGIFPNA